MRLKKKHKNALKIRKNIIEKIPKIPKSKVWLPTSISEINLLCSRAENVQSLSNMMGKNINWFNRLLKDDDIKLKPNDLIPQLLAQRLKDYWFSKLPERTIYKMKTRTIKNKGSKSKSGVYDKLKVYGPGKIILIRSK